MNPIEIQQLIDAHEWETLNEVEVWDFRVFMRSNNARINKELVLEFFIAHPHFLARSSAKLLHSLLVTSVTVFTVKEYEKMLEGFGNNINAYLLMFTEEKDHAFLEFFINNYSKILSLPLVKLPMYINKQLLGDGSLNEEFANILNNYNVMRKLIVGGLIVDSAGIDFFIEHISVSSTLDILDSSKSINADLIKRAKFKLTEEAVMTYIYETHTPSLNVQIMLLKLGKAGYAFSDDNLKTLFNSFPLYVVHVMTKEQLTKFKDELGLGTALYSSKITLDELADLYPGERAETPPAGFHTEEEIAKHPQFFNPKSTGISRFYFTRETLKILNREWGTRQRYDVGTNGDATKVLLRNIIRITPENIRYLDSKGVDWSSVYNFGANEYNLDGPLTVVSKFIIKYKDQ